MGRLTLAFDGRPSAVRSWDIRFRVAGILALSLGIAGTPAWGLVFQVPLVLGFLGLAGARPGEILRVVRGFAPFLAFFFAVGWVFEPTGAQALFLGWQSLRLTLLLLAGHGLFLSATPADVTEGLRWYLGWLGPRRAWAAASMAGWALASVPSVLDQASGLGEAAALRGLEPRRHPLRTLRALTLGLLVRTFERSADLAAALEARGFGLEVPPPVLKSRPRDALGLAAAVLGVAGTWAFGAILGP